MGASTATELAARLDVQILVIRPKLSGLKNRGVVVDTGEKRGNETVYGLAAARHV